MSSNIQGIFQAFLPQANQSNSQSSAVVTERVVTTTNQSSPRYVLGNQQPSFAANVNESNFVGSPRTTTRVEATGFNMDRTNQTKSGVTTTYYNSSSVSPVPTRTYQYSSSAFQSPEHNITAFNEGFSNPSSNNQAATTRTVTYTSTIQQNDGDQKVDSGSQVQRELYKTSPLVQNGSGTSTYEYKRIINESQRKAVNDGSISPVNNLSDGNLNAAEHRYFSKNVGNDHQRVNSGHEANKNLESVQSVTESIYEYHPIKPVGNLNTVAYKQSSPVVSLQNRTKPQSTFESYTYGNGYSKPSSGNKVTFGGANVVGNGISNNVGTHTYQYAASRQPQVITTYNTQTVQPRMQSTYTTQNVQTFHIPQVITHQTQFVQPQVQVATYQSQRQAINQETLIENVQATKNSQKTKKIEEIYQVVDQIERPKYEKLYGLEDTYSKRMMVGQDPPTKKGCCGPLCWLPLVLIGAILGLFGMLCGLGVVCPGGASIKSYQGSGSTVSIEPSVVGNSTEPLNVTPNGSSNMSVSPVNIKPSEVQPISQPDFSAGVPSSQPVVVPSYVAPISIAPSANASAPIVPGGVDVSNVQIVSPPVVPQVNLTVVELPPISLSPEIEISPEVINFNTSVIDATSVTNINASTSNVTVSNVSTSNVGTTTVTQTGNEQFAPIQIVPDVVNQSTVSTTIVANTSVSPLPITIQPTVPTVITTTEQQITTPIDSISINPIDSIQINPIPEIIPINVFTNTTQESTNSTNNINSSTVVSVSQLTEPITVPEPQIQVTPDLVELEPELSATAQTTVIPSTSTSTVTTTGNSQNSSTSTPIDTVSTVFNDTALPLSNIPIITPSQSIPITTPSTPTTSQQPILPIIPDDLTTQNIPSISSTTEQTPTIDDLTVLPDAPITQPQIQVLSPQISPETV